MEGRKWSLHFKTPFLMWYTDSCYSHAIASRFVFLVKICMIHRIMGLTWCFRCLTTILRQVHIPRPRSCWFLLDRCGGARLHSICSCSFLHNFLIVIMNWFDISMSYGLPWNKTLLRHRSSFPDQMQRVSGWLFSPLLLQSLMQFIVYDLPIQ